MSQPRIHRLIGTPYAMNTTRVMLLGSGELGREITIALQRLNMEVIAVDRYAHAPAHVLAHRAYVQDMTDGNALLALIEQERPHLIVPEIEAINTEVLATVEARGLAEVMPNVRAVQLAMNRVGIRQLAAEQLGLPTSPYAFAESLTELHNIIQHKIGCPCFVKPIMSSSGKGQSFVQHASEIEQAWQYAQQAGRVQQCKVIVEGKIDFDYEITLLTVRALLPNGEAGIQFCEPIGHKQVDGDYVESWQPQAMSPQAWLQAKNIARSVVDNLGGLGIFGVELFVRGDQVWFSEVSPRPHDTGLVTMASQRFSEFELHARAILGLPVDVSLIQASASAVIYGQHDTARLGFEGLFQALEVPTARVHLFGKPMAFKKRRMGVVLASGNTTEIARTRAQEALRQIKTMEQQPPL